LLEPDKMKALTP